jgi:PAS domain-containing protein
LPPSARLANFAASAGRFLHLVPRAPAGTLLDSAVPLAGLGCWSWTLPTDRIALSPDAQRIFGYAEGGLRWNVDVVAAQRRCGRRPGAAKHRDQVRSGQGTFSFEYRFTTPQGRVKRLKTDGQVVALDDNGQPLEDRRHGDGPGAPAQHAGRARLGAARPSPAPGTVYEWRWKQDAEHRFTHVQDSSHLPLPSLLDVVGHRRWDCRTRFP